MSRDRIRHIAPILGRALRAVGANRFLTNDVVYPEAFALPPHAESAHVSALLRQLCDHAGLRDILVEVTTPSDGAERPDARATNSPHREAEVFLVRLDGATATFAVNLERPRYLVGAASHEVAHLFSVFRRGAKGAYRESGSTDDDEEEAPDSTDIDVEERVQAIEVGLGFGLLAVNHCLVESGLAPDRHGCLRQSSFRLNRPGYVEWERVEELVAAHLVARGEDGASLDKCIHSIGPKRRTSFRASVSRHFRMRSTLIDAVDNLARARST